MANILALFQFYQAFEDLLDVQECGQEEYFEDQSLDGRMFNFHEDYFTYVW